MDFTENDDWIILCDTIDFTKSELGDYHFVPCTNMVQKTSCDGSIWQLFINCSTSEVELNVLCKVGDNVTDSESRKIYSERYESLVEKCQYSAVFYRSIPLCTSKFMEKEVCFSRSLSQSNESIFKKTTSSTTTACMLSFVTKYNVKSVFSNEGMCETSHHRTPATQKILFSFVFRSAVSEVQFLNMNSGLLKFPTPLRSDVKNIDYSWFLTKEGCDTLRNKLHRNPLPYTEMSECTFGRAKMITSEINSISFALNAIALPGAWIIPDNNTEDDIYVKWSKIFNCGKYSDEGITLFLQFIYGKRDGFSHETINATHFIDFIQIASLCTDFYEMEFVLFDLLYLFADCVKTNKNVLQKCLSDIMRHIIKQFDVDDNKYIRFLLFYFEQTFTSRCLRELVLSNLEYDTGISNIKFLNDGCVAGLLPIKDVEKYLNQMICDNVINYFEKHTRLMRYDVIDTSALKNMRHGWLSFNWSYLIKTHMISRIQEDVCMCYYLVAEGTLLNTLKNLINDNEQLHFLKMVNRVVSYVNGGLIPETHALYFEFRFSSTLYSWIIISIPSPFAYLRWPWFKAMIESGMEESKTKSMTLPESVTPEIIFVIACCLSNRLVRKSMSTQALEWFHSDESSILGIKDADGNPHDVFKQLFEQ